MATILNVTITSHHKSDSSVDGIDAYILEERCQISSRSDLKQRSIGVRAKGAEGGGLQPPDSGKTIIFRAKAKFFGQKPVAKNEKKYFFVYLLSEKNGIHSV